MEENIQEKLGYYLELLGKIKESVQDESTAVRILGEVAKDARMQQIRQERQGHSVEPATQKQRAFLKELGVEVPKRLTKELASQVIDVVLRKSGVLNAEGREMMQIS